MGSKYIKGLGDAIGSIHGTVDMFSLGALPNGEFTNMISFHLFKSKFAWNMFVGIVSDSNMHFPHVFFKGKNSVTGDR